MTHEIDDDAHDALNSDRDTDPRASGLRFYWYADEDWMGEGGGERAELDDELHAPGVGGAPEAARTLADTIGGLVGGTGAWRPLPCGGAGENGIVELIAYGVTAIGFVHGLLKTPGLAKEAWGHVAMFLGRAKSERLAWEASSEVAILKCLAIVQEEWPGAFTDPEVVRVIEDGVMAAFPDRPTGVHVIVIPDLEHKKTHVFAIDQSLVIHGRMMLDRLTTDGESVAP